MISAACTGTIFHVTLQIAGIALSCIKIAVQVLMPASLDTVSSAYVFWFADALISTLRYLEK